MSFDGMRIALIGPLAPPAGGMANQMEQIAALLRSEGAIVTTLQTNRPHRPHWIAEWRGVRAVARLMPYLAESWRAIGTCDAVHVLANSGWSWNLFAAPVLRIARLRAVPCLVHYHGGEAEAFLARSPRVITALRRANALVVPSLFLKEVFARYGIESRVVPNLLDLDGFCAPTRRIGPEPHLAVTRNLERVYDIPTALRAFALIRERFPGATLSIAGSGPEYAALRALSSSLGLDAAVAFTGRLTTREVKALLYRADVLLNPSTADNLPMSILEAMAAEVPVVSTRAGGVPYMVSDGESALLVDVGDAPGMALAALRLLTDAPLRERLTHKARMDVEQYRAPRVRAALAAVYDAMLADMPSTHTVCR